jgi:nicotinamide mononucleotide adenylyltransferase
MKRDRMLQKMMDEVKHVIFKRWSVTLNSLERNAWLLEELGKIIFGDLWKETSKEQKYFISDYQKLFNVWTLLNAKKDLDISEIKEIILQ